MQQTQISKPLASLRLANRWFWIFALLHGLIWTLAPTLIYRNPPTDSLEGIAWGNLWLLGYEKHPFLAPWLSAAFTHLFGIVGFPIYLLSQLAIMVCFWAVFKLAKEFLTPLAALVAVVLLEGINYYNLQSAIFDPNVLMLPFWALTSLYFYYATTRFKLTDWILTGIFAGLAFVSKYESGLLFILLAFLTLTSENYRKQWRMPGPYLAIFIALLIFLPNFYWLAHHHFDAIRYAVGEMQATTKPTDPLIQPISNTFKFIFEQVGNILPLFLLYWPFYHYRQTNVRLTDDARNFIGVIALGPTVLTILLALFADADLVSRWSFPFFSFLGVIWLVWQNPQLNLVNLKKFAYTVVIYNMLLVIGMAFYFLTLPVITHKATHSDTFPGQAIANYVTQQWQAKYHTPLPYVVGSHHVVVNIAAFSKVKPISFFDWSLAESPWINLQDLKNKGGVFVYWQQIKNRLTISQIESMYPNLQDERMIAFKRLTAAKTEPVQIWIAYLPPNNKLF